jgi:hypothetical protein
VNQRIQELIEIADLCAASLMASGATEEEIQNRSKVVLAQLIIEDCASRAEAYSYMSDNFIALAKELREMKK